MQFNINLTSLAVILWSGMLVIAGSIWVLSSQVRKMADLLEDHSRRAFADELPLGTSGGPSWRLECLGRSPDEVSLPWSAREPARERVTH